MDLRALPACVAIALACVASADVINVPADQPTIQAAIGVAANGDEVIIAPGAYFEHIDFLGKAITVRSTDPTDPAIVETTIIDGGGAGTVVICVSGEGPVSVLSGVTITGGQAANGGGMYIENSSPTVTDCIFEGNAATQDGGGMSVRHGNPSVTRCLFVGNSAHVGGGLRDRISSNVVVTDCAFIGNSVVHEGGGIATYGLTAVGCLFDGNSANGVIPGQGNGGGLQQENGFSSLVDCTFINNTATRWGGGMILWGAAQATGCAFIDNSAGTGGGAYLELAEIGVADCDFTANTAEFYGGGLYATQNVSLVLQRCSFADNHAGQQGGGLVFKRGVVADSTIEGNTAGQIGGGVHLPGSVYGASLEGCLVSQNQADIGAGLYASTCSVVDCRIEENTAQTSGGGASVADVGVSGCQITGNAAAMGGAFHVIDGLTLSHSLMCGNTLPQTDGGWTDGGGNYVYEVCDCNENGVTDADDITSGDSLDCNGNGVPDECEIDADCNGNGVPDDCDIDTGRSLDCNENGLPDECEPGADCNDNGIYDFCDLIAGTSIDCNANGVPDECEVNRSTDENGDGILDVCQPVRNLTDGSYYMTIQGGIDAAQNGDELMLLDREYQESVDLLGKAIILRSIDPEDPAIVAATVISGNGSVDATVTCTSGEGPGTVINGLTIRAFFASALMWNDGADPTIRNCVVGGQDAFTEEGGIRNHNSSPLILTCRITAIDAFLVGGGIYSTGTSNPVVVATVVCGNYPDQIVGPWIDGGGNTVANFCPPCLLEVPADCNGNGVPDCDDIQSGVSQDCNGNGIPDVCDIAEGASADCDRNGVPDECDADCNGNDIPDICDVAEGTSADCNGNGVPDECEPDCNGNDIPDGCDIARGRSLDCDDNGIPDECELGPDCNGNGVPDRCDIAVGTSLDCNENATPDECEDDGDCNRNGVTDFCDIASGTSLDCNGNGVPDECDGDCNGNGLPDDCDVESGRSPDCNGNGDPDECDLAEGGSEDCNGNGIPDECDLASGLEVDCNGNGVLDACDIAAGTLADRDGDGIPDVCEPVWNLTAGTYHLTIQVAIDAATDGDELMLLEGVFQESVSLLGKAITLRSTNPDDPAVVAATVMRGDGRTSTIRCESGEGRDTVISGLTIQSASTGLANTAASPTISRCVFTGFTGHIGAAIENGDSSPLIVSCRITDNHAKIFIGGGILSGGTGAPTLVGTIVCGNSPSQITGPWIDGGDNYVADECPPCGPFADCNDNGIDDCVDLSSGTSTDCNANGVPDECDIAGGRSEDCDGNGTPDECDGDPITGSALNFDDVDARVTMSSFVGMPSCALTMSLWMRSTGDGDGIVSYAAADPSNNEFLIFAQENLAIYVDNQAVTTGIDVADGLWHHVAVTWRSSTGALVVYVDGVEAFADVLSQGAAVEDGGTLMLGQEQDCLGGCLDPIQAYVGDFDEVRLWNVIRTAEEIGADRFSTLTGDEPGLVGYWPMDEGAGGSAQDLAGRNHGVVSGATWIDTVAASGCCSADIDASGDVAFADLLAVLSAWGPCNGCPEDTDSDGLVGFNDLLTVLSTWGPCP